MLSIYPKLITIDSKFEWLTEVFRWRSYANHSTSDAVMKACSLSIRLSVSSDFQVNKVAVVNTVLNSAAIYYSF